MGRKRGVEIDGWLIVDKDLTVGSTDVVAKSRRLFDAKKVGHAGTLDPLATGVLPIAFGRATKAIPYIMDATKEYRFTLSFGEARDTDDREGQAIAWSDVRPSDAQIEAALPALVGDVMQVPPVYSALKVGGQRAYDLARAGRPPELSPRPARIDAVTLIDRPDADTAAFHVRSGKGVYMRALARDIARACGSVGHIAVLRRTKCGPFTEDHAITLDKLAQNVDNAPASPALLRPVVTALVDIPALALTEAEARALSYGQTLDVGLLADRLPARNDPDAVMRTMIGERAFGMAKVEGDRLRSVRLF